MSNNSQNAIIKIISRKVDMSIGETKDLIIELAEVIKEEREF